MTQICVNRNSISVRLPGEIQPCVVRLLPDQVGNSIPNIAAAGAVDREFVYICRFVCYGLGRNMLMEGRERFKKVPGGRRIHSG